MLIFGGSACTAELIVSQQHAPAFPAQLMERRRKSYWDVLLLRGTLRVCAD